MKPQASGLGFVCCLDQFEGGVPSEQPPSAITDAAGKPTEFSVELVNEAAKRLNLKVQYRTTTLQGVLAGLSAGQYDIGDQGPDRADHTAPLGRHRSSRGRRCRRGRLCRQGAGAHRRESGESPGSAFPMGKDGDPKLLKDIDDQIDAMIEDGTYIKLYRSTSATRSPPT